jgi:hypothetical protein
MVRSDTLQRFASRFIVKLSNVWREVSSMDEACLPVLFTTGYTLNAIAHRSRLDPRVHLIGKLFIYAELTAKGKRMLGRD